MALSDSEKAEFARVTRSAAFALVEDLQHVREILAQERPTRGDIRRISGLLRRLLIEGDLREIAAPRIGRVTVEAPDTAPFINSKRGPRYLFYSVGIPEIYGMTLHWTGVSYVPEGGERIEPASKELEAPVAVLRLDKFLSQTVMSMDAYNVTRAEVIKYVANVAHGVHTTSPKNRGEEVLDRIRAFISLESCDQFWTLHLDQDALLKPEQPLAFDQRHPDFTLMHVFSTAYHLVHSSDVRRLESIIASE